MWNFACRNCGHRDTYAGYPFKSSGEFPRCTRCGGQTYRPSLEDEGDLQRDLEHEDGTEDFEREECRA
jgi:DNA-directed RNA polymerase subunit RPC12/RpoP